MEVALGRLHRGGQVYIFDACWLCILAASHLNGIQMEPKLGEMEPQWNQSGTKMVPNGTQIPKQIQKEPTFNQNGTQIHAKWHQTIANWAEWHDKNTNQRNDIETKWHKRSEWTKTSTTTLARYIDRQRRTAE